jgi:23S rRNA pseudouridine955/2504/2580 synthase
MKAPLLLQVDQDQADRRLDRFLKHHLQNLTQTAIEKALRKGDIRVNGQKATSSQRTNLHDQVEVAEFLTKLEGTSVKKTPVVDSLSMTDLSFIEENILWEDKHLLVFNKPQGLATQGGTGTSRHVDGLFKAYGLLKRQDYKLVHRLDRDTSGVLVLAKTTLMARHLMEAFKNKTVQKTYQALIEGMLEPRYGQIDLPLLKSKVGTKEKIVVDPKGDKAQTTYRTLKISNNRYWSWVELQPKTGRTHQLRVHMQASHTPILGDFKYGARSGKNLMLHAFKLELRDLDGDRLTFEAPLPPYFKAFLDKEFTLKA